VLGPTESLLRVCLLTLPLLKSRWLDISGYFPADCSRGGARDLQAVASDGHRKTILHVQTLFAIPLPPVSMSKVLCQPAAPCVSAGNFLPVVPRSRCSNSSKTVVKETPSKNSKLFEAHSVASADSATSVLRAQEQPSHKPSLYSAPSYPSDVFPSSNSTAQHQQENLPASSTQSEGNKKNHPTKQKPDPKRNPKTWQST